MVGSCLAKKKKDQKKQNNEPGARALVYLDKDIIEKDKIVKIM